MKAEQLFKQYYNLENDVLSYYNKLSSQLEDTIVFTEDDENIYLDYRSQSSGKCYEGRLKSIDNIGNIVVLDHDLGEEVETVISDYELFQQIMIIEQIEEYNFNKLK